MFKIRPYQTSDSQIVGQLIADTYCQYNLGFVAPDEQSAYLGPFQHAYSHKKEHREEIVRIIDADIILVAEDADGEILGVLRGKKERLHSLFVRGSHHRQGIGRMLMERFEEICRQSGCQKITMASTLYAVGFYQSLGYKKSTGVRSGWSFDGPGLQWQPMKKTLS
jgi:GNAT superfamily N-acetyltransferase